MRRSLLLLSLMLNACAPSPSPKDNRTIHGVDPVFVSYIDLYVSYKGHGLYYDIPVQFADLSGNTVGLCTRWSTGERQIQIDRTYWDSFDEGEKIEVMFHELGHCDLNRDHVLTTKNAQPVSIMYPYVFELYPNAMSYYAFELFNPTASTQQTSLALKTDCVHDIEVESHE